MPEPAASQARPARPLTSRSAMMRHSVIASGIRRRQQQQAEQQPRGLVAKLWPTDQPVYKRPAAIGGAVLLAAGIAYLLLGGGGGGRGKEEPEEEETPPTGA